MSRTNGPDDDLPPNPTGFEALIGTKELAAWLGVSQHAVRKWCSQGPGTGRTPRMLRVNGQIRFRPADVREWLASKEIQ